MDQASHPVVVLFADVSGSSKLYDTLGNTDAQNIVLKCLSIMSEVTERFNGQTVKTIGDEVMCIFPTATDACQAASEMQVGVRNSHEPDDLPFGRLQIRIGMHIGQVLEETGDVFGETVNVAARMARLAKPDQILTTDATIIALPPELLVTTRFVDEQTMRGRLDKMDLYEILWEISDLTDMAMAAPPESMRIQHRTLSLHCQGTHIELNEQHPRLTIGRNTENQIMVSTALTSRKHARLDYRRSRFVLTDQSVNGTFVVRSDGRRTNLRRDDLTLDGSGWIGIGEPPEEGSDFSIQYSCIN